MVSKTHKHHVQGKIAPQYDVVVNANSNGDVCTINNPLPVVNVGSSNNIDLAAGLLTGSFSYQQVWVQSSCRYRV